LSVNAFHEKAGRSQVGSLVFSLDKVFPYGRVATVATLPSPLSLSDWAIRFADAEDVAYGGRKQQERKQLFQAVRSNGGFPSEPLESTAD
jgi:hypothetical protein